MTIRHKTWLFAATSALALAASCATAQEQPIPPEHYTLDAHGVDLVSGSFNFGSTEVAIGPADGGLAYGRFFTNEGWRDTSISSVVSTGTERIVSVGSISEVFVLSGSTWVSKYNNGSTYTILSSGLKITDRHGVVAIFDARLGLSGNPYGADYALVTSITTPSGEVTTYTYQEDRRCTTHCRPVVRLSAITNNRGYMLKYAYASDDADDTEWWRLTNVRGINLAVDYCDASADSCSSFTQTWPSVTYSDFSTGGWPKIVTDEAGHMTSYTYGGGGIASIRYPGATADDLTVAYNASPDFRVNAVTDISGAWTYAYATAGSTQTTTASGPLGQELIAEADMTIGRATSLTDALGNELSYQYDSDLRVIRVDQPQGDFAEYDYDGRSNVTQVTYNARPSSGLADIVTSAAYPSTCVNPVTCNLPTSTTDAAGNVTDYTWDSTHGGPLTVTLPAATVGGTRPQTRYAYAAQTAQFKNSSGVVVAAPTSVTLPIEVSACATGASCDATADEVLTTMGYGVTTGVANNLNVASVSRGSGASPSMAVTAMTWTPDGDVATVDGPLSGTGDTTQYRYDTSRRMVGMVGPDPDGGGAGLNRAQRVTYNDRGQPTLSEIGTTAGYTDPNWAAFSPLLKSSVAYDDQGRLIESRQLSAAGVASGVQQVTYDAAGRVSCSATRMNPTTFGSLPSSACTAATVGAFGPDRITQTTYDVANRPLSVTTGLGTAEAVTQSQTWTTGGQIGSLTDGDGNVSIMEYDGFNRIKRLRYPNATGGGTSNTDDEGATYDVYGRLSTSHNRSGQPTAYTYDNLNRITFVDAPPMVDDHYFQYDLLGRRTSISTTGTLPVTCNAQTTCLTWDPLSRLTSETTDLGAMTYGYDAAGRTTSLTWADGFAADYAYDLYGAVTAIDQHPSGGGATQIAAYGWNNLGQPTSVSRASGAGASTAWGYDAWGRMNSLAHDASGTAQDVTLGYSYNPAGQIVGRMVSNASYLYGASPTGATAYAVDGLNQLDSIDSVAVTQDSRGNVTNVLGRTYGYDRLDRMISANAGAGASLFTYDPTSRLATSRVGGVTSQRQYAGDQLVAEYNPATGAMTKRYIPGLGLDDVAVAYDGSGTSTRNWQLADERGSVIALAGSTGAVSNINTYDEYGVPASGNVGRFQYTGQQWLPEARAYHYRARAYLPQTGRFLQTDPAGYSAGQNLYAYVRGEPVNMTDPSGMFNEPPPVTTLPGSVVVGPRLKCKSGRTCVAQNQYTEFIIFDNFDLIPWNFDLGEWGHVYEIDTMVCRVHAPQSIVADVHRRVSYPGQNPARPVSNGDRVTVSTMGIPGGRVDIYLSPDGLTNVNTTVPFQHALQGTITQTVYQSGDTWRLNTFGVGRNELAPQQFVNAVAGPQIFLDVHQRYADALRERVPEC